MNNREVLFCSQRMGLRECSGQMAVELAILMPIIIVVACAVLNLLYFAEFCARFDTVSIDSVLTHAVSPAGHEYLAGINAARDELALAIDDSACDIEVRTEDAHHDGEGLHLGLVLKLHALSVPFRIIRGPHRYKLLDLYTSSQHLYAMSVPLLSTAIRRA